VECGGCSAQASSASPRAMTKKKKPAVLQLSLPHVRNPTYGLLRPSSSSSPFKNVWWNKQDGTKRHPGGTVL